MSRVSRSAVTRIVGQELVEGFALPTQVSKPSAALEDLNLPLEHVDGLTRGTLESLGAELGDEGVRILAVGKRDHANGDAVRQQLVARS